MNADYIDELLNRVEAICDCGIGKPSQLAKHLNVPSPRISEWIRQRAWRPSGLATLSIQGWAAKMTNKISRADQKTQQSYRDAYKAVCRKRGRD